MNANFDKEVQALLVKRRGKFREIAERTGISYSWLSKFASGHISNPGFEFLRRLSALFSDGSI